MTEDTRVRTRLQIEFAPELMGVLDELQKDLGVTSRVDAIRLAVRYLRRITRNNGERVTVSFSDGVLVFHESPKSRLS